MSTQTKSPGIVLDYVKTIGIVNNGFSGRGFANPYDIVAVNAIRSRDQPNVQVAGFTPVNTGMNGPVGCRNAPDLNDFPLEPER